MQSRGSATCSISPAVTRESRTSMALAPRGNYAGARHNEYTEPACTRQRRTPLAAHITTYRERSKEPLLTPSSSLTHARPALRASSLCYGLRGQRDVHAPRRQLVQRHKRRGSAVQCAAGQTPQVNATGAQQNGGVSLWSSLMSSIRTQFSQASGMMDRLAPMSGLFCAMAFVNTLLDSTKDTLIVTMGGGGAEALPFLVPYAVLPCSFLFVIAYTFLSSHCSRRTLFNVILGSFISFFVVFSVVLFPNQEAFQANALADNLARWLPAGMSGLVSIVRTWSFTLFYIVAELWGDIVLSLLFWSLANDTTSLEDAHVLYPMYGIGGNIAQTLAGQTLKALSNVTSRGYGYQLTLIMGLCTAMGVIIVSINHLLNERHKRKALADAALDPPPATAATNGAPAEQPAKVEKSKLSVMEAIRYLTKSPAIRCLAIMAVAQGVSINLLEVAWKSHLRLLHSTPQAYAAFLGDMASVTGLCTMCMMLVSPLVFKVLGWSGAAAATPMMLLTGGSAFFAAGVALHYVPMAPAMYHTCLGLLVLLGASTIVLCRASKFSLFKPAEEMVYIGLDEESRTKGKAAIDVTGAQAGKSIGSYIVQALLVAGGGTLFGAMPVMVACYGGILVLWIRAVGRLSKVRMSMDETMDTIDEVDASTDDLACPLPESCPLDYDDSTSVPRDGKDTDVAPRISPSS